VKAVGKGGEDPFKTDPPVFYAEVVFKVEAKEVQGKHSGGRHIIPIKTLENNLRTSNNQKGFSLDLDDVEHELYKPKNLTKYEVEKDGSMKIEYDTYSGTHFVALLDPKMLVTSIQGKNLKLKTDVNISRRGVTERSLGYIENEQLNAAHLIADQFLGSGYKESNNLITTSDYFNKKIMGGIEQKIVAYIKNKEANEFDMTVNVSWGDLNSSQVIHEIMQRIPSLNREKARADIESFIDRVKPSFKRCMNVNYSVTVTNQSTEITKPWNTGPDLWLGLSIKR
jgi:hypothetical protein